MFQGKGQFNYYSIDLIDAPGDAAKVQEEVPVVLTADRGPLPVCDQQSWI